MSKKYKRGYDDGRFDENIVMYMYLTKKLEEAEEQYRITQHPYWNGIADCLATTIQEILQEVNGGRVR